MTHLGSPRKRLKTKKWLFDRDRRASTFRGDGSFALPRSHVALPGLL